MYQIFITSFGNFKMTNMLFLLHTYNIIAFDHYIKKMTRNDWCPKKPEETTRHNTTVKIRNNCTK